MISAETIRDRVCAHLEQADAQVDDIRITEDPYGGFRLIVVSGKYESLSPRERRALTLDEDLEESLTWFDLVAPDEVQTDVIDEVLTEGGQLPLWSSALASDRYMTQSPLFPSDLDAPLAPPLRVTYFSLRGGVGRSTALAATAHQLTKFGHKVLCVDMDLEAPGLAGLFGVEEHVRSGMGVVDCMLALDNGHDFDLAQHLLKLTPAEEMYLLPAGIPDARYARKLAEIDPTAWYEEDRNPLRELFSLSAELTIAPDIILIDARTGISPLNAPLVFDISDLVVLAFFPHPQSRVGTRALLHAVLSSRTVRDHDPPLTPEPQLMVSPIPPPADPSHADYWETIAKEAIGEWILPTNRSRQGANRSQLDVDELTHQVYYDEHIANSTEITEDASWISAFSPLAEWISGFLPDPAMVLERPSSAPGKSDVLEELYFATGIAEAQEPEEFNASFLRTATVAKAARVEVPLVLGRKGAGKTALFRRLVEGNGTASRFLVGFTPHSWRGRPSWLPDSSGFRAIDEARIESRHSWETYWLLHLITVLSANEHVRGDRSPSGDNGLEPLMRPHTSILEYVESIRQAFYVRDVELIALEWLERTSTAMESTIAIAFDGLDTEFGGSPEQRERRNEATSALLAVADRLSHLEAIGVKIFLRWDIWVLLSLPNKSHFFGRSVMLSWPSKFEYLKVVIKQALLREVFRSYVAGRVSPATRALLNDVDVDVGDWPDSATREVWQVLVGLRMAGGKTAFTDNWVWNRLADGQGSHSPRSLSQLFYTAREREGEFEVANPYAVSVIRPRALRESLVEVSIEACGALGEEYPELEPILTQLRSLRKTPFDANELDRDRELERLAIEAGLLSASVSDPDLVERYRVPDLYRLGLEMGRRGQA